MFEHQSKPLLPRKAFYRRLQRYVLYAFVLLAGSLAIGMAGYHWIARLSWMDAFLNASMILTGMGPIDEMLTAPAKIFSGLYALYSGIAFLTTVAVMFSPIAHRFLHKLHVEETLSE